MYYFIVNPSARRGHGEKIWKRLECRVARSGIEYEVRMTTGQGEAMRIAAELTEGGREPLTIIAVGGDGTVNEVLNGLSFGRPVTVGYIPTGSGNDLARSLRLPHSPIRCLKRVLKPRCYRTLDYGVLSYEKGEPVHRRFLVSSGIGLDAAVCHDKLELSHRWYGLGRAGYWILGIRQLITARPVKGYLLLDGVKKVEFNHIYFISSHIHPCEGGGFRFAPKADYCDGLLDLCVVHNSSKYQLVPVLLDALAGRMGHHRGVRVYRCREVQIHVDRPMPVHVDGESCFCQTDIHLRCVERQVRMML